LIGQEPRHECCMERYFLNLEAPELDLVIEAAVQSKSQTASTSNSRSAIAYSFIVCTLSVVFWTTFWIHANSADDLSTLTSK